MAGNGLPPGVKVQDPQNQNPDAKGLIRRMDKPELRVFLPAADRATGTAVIICPGGGYGLLDYKAHVAEFVADYQQQGIAVIALLYKVPTNADLALTEGKLSQDGLSAAWPSSGSWSEEDRHARVFGGWAPAGELDLACRRRRSPIAGPAGPAELPPELRRVDVPLEHLESGKKHPLKAPLPPVFLACADDDKVSINFSDPLAERLKELQTPVLYWRVHGGGHPALPPAFSLG